MAFQLYTKTRAISEEESVSLSSVGVLTVSPAATEKYLKNVNYVQLYFDPTSRRVGIKPVRKDEKYAYQLIRTKNGRRALVSGRAFLRSYKIHEMSKGRFKPQKFEAKLQDGMIVFGV